MKLLEFIAKAIELHKEVGDVEVVSGDCNKMFKVIGIDSCIIEDLGEHYLQEIHKDDADQYEPPLPINAVVVYC